MTTMRIHFLVVFCLSACGLLPVCESGLYRLIGDDEPERRTNLTDIRQQLVSDVDERSDSHKVSGHGYAEVRTLLHKFNRIAAEKAGKQIDMNDENTINSELLIVDDGTELSRNQAIAADLFEGDIVLTLEQIQRMIHRQEQSGGSRSRRKVITDLNNIIRWPNGIIPFTFDDSDGDWQDVIRAAMAHWESETCIRFKDRNNDPDYIRFYKGQGRERGCHSAIGRVGGAQGISIGKGCEVMGIIAHEIGHTVGFFHEQSRPDRDSFINVRYDHIVSSMLGNFVKAEESDVNDFDVPYDLGSVMHYGSSGFAIDYGVATIETRDTKYKETIGQRAHLSFIDVKQANMAYCRGKCSGRLECQNGGYDDPNDCSKCKCPEGLSGKLCNSLQPSSCGQELIADDEWRELSNSDIDGCYWSITGASGGKIRFEVKRADFPCNSEEACSSYVEIKHKASFDQTGFRVCCEAGGGEALSEMNVILVLSKGPGNFVLAYRSEGGNPTERQQTLSPLPVLRSTRTILTTPSIATTVETKEWTEVSTEMPTPRRIPMRTEEPKILWPLTPYPIDRGGGQVVYPETGGMIIDNGSAGRVVFTEGGGMIVDNGSAGRVVFTEDGGMLVDNGRGERYGFNDDDSEEWVNRGGAGRMRVNYGGGSIIVR